MSGQPFAGGAVWKVSWGWRPESENVWHRKANLLCLKGFNITSLDG